MYWCVLSTDLSIFKLIFGLYHSSHNYMTLCDVSCGAKQWADTCNAPWSRRELQVQPIILWGLITTSDTLHLVTLFWHHSPHCFHDYSCFMHHKMEMCPLLKEFPVKMVYKVGGKHHLRWSLSPGTDINKMEIAIVQHVAVVRCHTEQWDVNICFLYFSRNYRWDSDAVKS